jgi:hypothetical protein
MLSGSGGFEEEKDLFSVTGFEHRIVQTIAQSRADEPFRSACPRAVFKSKMAVGVCHNY